jgi:hypothetical protein
VDLGPAFAPAQRGLERIHDPLPPVRGDLGAVEDDREGSVFRNELRVLQPHDVALLEHAAEPRLGEGLAHDRGLHLAAHAVREADEHRVAIGLAEERLEDRRRRVAQDHLAAAPALEGCRACVEGPQVVGDRGHRAHGRARGADGRGAIHGYGRQHAVDALGPGPVEPLQELPRVGAEGLGVASVAFGVEDVEGERGLSGARHAGDRGDRSHRNADGDALQVVLAGPFDVDLSAHGHGRPL